jgi:protein phosphatase
MENETFSAFRNLPKSSLFRIPDPSLILLVGPSGAGKSTFAARHFLPTEIISSDRCRAMICDDEADQSVTHSAFALLHHITRARLSVRRLTVVDATNLEFRARRPLLRIARMYRIPIVALVFNVSLETCLRHNRARAGRFVIEEVLNKHAQELRQTLPRLEREGYAGIYLLDESNLAEARIERVRIIAPAPGVIAGSETAR